MQTAPFIIGKQSDSLFSIHPLGMRLGEAEKFNVDAGLPTAESIHEKTVFLSTLAVVVKNQNAAQSGCPDLLVSSVAVGTQDKTDATMFGNVSARNASLIGHETDVLPNSPRPDQGIDCTKDLLSISGPDVLRGEEEIDGGGTSSYEGMTVQKECLEVGSVKLNRTAQIRGQVSEQARMILDQGSTEKGVLLRPGSGFLSRQVGIENCQSNPGEGITAPNECLELDSSKPNGRLQILGQVSEQARMILDHGATEKGVLLRSGSGFLSRQVGIENCQPNPGEGITAPNECFEMGPSKLNGRFQIVVKVSQEATMISDQKLADKEPSLRPGLHVQENDWDKRFSIERGPGSLDRLVTDASRLDGRSQDAAQVAEKTYALDERFIDGNANSIKKERLAILDSYGQVSKGATGNAALGISYEESTRLELDPQQDPRATSIKGNSLLSPSINMLDRFGETMVHTRGGQIIPDSLQNNTLNQIIERAVLHLKSGQPEIKIDLKPEFLGHLRMLVSTENHQVAIRMMTEVPLAKEIIENNINHLKAELQNHGLQIDKFDVFVSQDSDQSGGEDKNGHLFGMEDGSFCDEELDATLVEEIGETIQSVEERDEVNLINLFA